MMYYYLFILILILVIAIILIIIPRRPEPVLVVRKSPLGGRGVYANRSFKEGDVVETCPVLAGKDDEWGVSTEDYLFTTDDDTSVLPLGYGSLYNHRDDPSAIYDIDAKKKVMVVRAARPIRRGEEITVTYGDDWWDTRTLKKRE
jgi:hypothetical protein